MRAQSHVPRVLKPTVQQGTRPIGATVRAILPEPACAHPPPLAYLTTLDPVLSLGLKFRLKNTLVKVGLVVGFNIYKQCAMWYGRKMRSVRIKIGRLLFTIKR